MSTDGAGTSPGWPPRSRGGFFHPYLILHIYSRKIVGWEVHERETAELATELVRKTVWAEGCHTRPLVLHAENGSLMKGATMKATLERLGVIASYSRPRVSDDNPFSEALFWTCKYRPDWPASGFASKARRATLGRSFHGLVQPRAPPQRDPVRHARRSTPWRGPGTPRGANHSLSRTAALEPGGHARHRRRPAAP